MVSHITKRERNCDKLENSSKKIAKLYAFFKHIGDTTANTVNFAKPPWTTQDPLSSRVGDLSKVDYVQLHLLNDVVEAEKNHG